STWCRPRWCCRRRSQSGRARPSPSPSDRGWPSRSPWPPWWWPTSWVAGQGPAASRLARLADRAVLQLDRLPLVGLPAVAVGPFEADHPGAVVQVVVGLLDHPLVGGVDGAGRPARRGAVRVAAERHAVEHHLGRAGGRVEVVVVLPDDRLRITLRIEAH